jgi:hypothetical protein
MNPTKLCEKDCYNCGYETASDKKRLEYIAKRHLAVTDEDNEYNNIHYAYTEWERK